MEEVGERRCALVGLEAVLLVDPDPGQLLPPPRKFVATPGQLLLRLEQFQPGCKPLFTCSGLDIGHRFFLVTSHRWRKSGNRRRRDDDQVAKSDDRQRQRSTSMAAFAGRSFWARTRTAITDIQLTLMTPIATNISIRPMLEPTQ